MRSASRTVASLKASKSICAGKLGVSLHREEEVEEKSGFTSWKENSSLGGNKISIKRKFTRFSIRQSKAGVYTFECELSKNRCTWKPSLSRSTPKGLHNRTVKAQKGNERLYIGMGGKRKTRAHNHIKSERILWQLENFTLNLEELRACT